MKKNNNFNFQNIIFNLQKFWSNKGFTIFQPIDTEVGAGTSHPITYFNSLNKNHIYAAYVQPSRRPLDGRYGKNINRLYHYYQFQVIMKPSLINMKELYISSLKYLGINFKINDIIFIEDNWENPTLGACGLGWEVWLNGMEITQFTYFQQMGGIKCKPIIGEITYGLERIAMYLQEVNSIYDIIWNIGIKGKIKYINIFYKHEFEYSVYNFKKANIKFLLKVFNQYEREIIRILNIKKPLLLPSYDLTLKMIHIFNILDSRQAISVIERQNYILKINNITKIIAKKYIS